MRNASPEKIGMSNGLLERVLNRLLAPPELHFSWRYALHITLITAAFHASSWIVVGIKDALPTKGDFSNFAYLPLMVGLSVLPYWAIFVMAGLSDQNKPGSSWRVWAAWLLITYPFAAFYLMMLFGEGHDAASGAGYAVIVLTILSPAVTVVGAVGGYLLYIVYRWLRNR